MNHQTKQLIDECHRLAWTAPDRGATKATISVRTVSVTYEDDAGTHRSWDTGGIARQVPFPLAHYLEECNAPQSLELDLSVERGGHPDMEPSVKRIPQAGDKAAATGQTADGRYLVHLGIGAEQSGMTITNPDGTVHRHHVHPYMTMREVDQESPERLVRHRMIRIAATPMRTDQEPATPQDVDNIIRAAATLLCEHMERINREGGTAWTDYCKPMDEMPEFYERLPSAPATGSRLPHGTGGREVALMGSDAIRIDAPHPAASAIALAWEAQNPLPSRHLYDTHDEHAPSLRVTSVEVTETNGVTTIYPGPVSSVDRATQVDESLSSRLGESRADNVARITLHYVISETDGSEQTGTLDCQAYADYDHDDQLLLICTDCALTEQELDDALDAGETARAYMNRCEESLAEMRLKQLTAGISGDEAHEGLEQALTEMANELARSTVPFLPLSRQVTATAGDGTVSIRIGPGAGGAAGRTETRGEIAETR